MKMDLLQLISRPYILAYIFSNVMAYIYLIKILPLWNPYPLLSAILMGPISFLTVPEKMSYIVYFFISIAIVMFFLNKNVSLFNSCIFGVFWVSSGLFLIIASV